jgi:hypothetical protein
VYRGGSLPGTSRTTGELIPRSVPGRKFPGYISDYRRDGTAKCAGAVVSRVHLDLTAGWYRGKYRYGTLPSTSRATGGMLPRNVPVRDNTGGGKSVRYDAAVTYARRELLRSGCRLPATCNLASSPCGSAYDARYLPTSFIQKPRMRKPEIVINTFNIPQM